jgi:transposase
VKRKPVIELNREELEAMLDSARSRPLQEEEYQKLKGVIETLAYLTGLIEKGKLSVRRLQQMLFGARTEKTQMVLKTEPSAKNSSLEPQDHQAGPCAEGPSTPLGEKEKSKGHGRNGAAAYSGATRVWVGHDSLKPGDPCPGCLKGKVYDSMAPSTLVRLNGQAPLGVKVWELEKLRCNLCGQVYTAHTPEEVGPEKYDETAASMIALLKYGSGFPFYRLQGLQTKLGIPLPASTQWEIVAETAAKIQPAYDQLLQQAAQGEVLYNDDTAAKILALLKEPTEEGERSGVFTSGIVSTREGRRIALFFTGKRHAGENLAEVLKKRQADLASPIHMCDALSRNMPRDLKVILTHCNAHARRKFVEVAPSFPDECRYVLEILRDVYHNDAITRTTEMTPEQRLLYHQAESGPRMEALQTWLREQIDEHKVEPNSTLGGAISYMLKHWERLTRFLHVPGVPLDNNITERALKKAILHRKSALFFKTVRGAQVADLFMSLIHTTELSGGNPFDYLTELQRHAAELSDNPQAWMPWNYRRTLAGLGSSPPAPT